VLTSSAPLSCGDHFIAARWRKEVVSAISPVPYRIPFSGWRKLAILFFLPAALVSWAAGQTTSSGALMVVVLDPSGAVITGASVHLTKRMGLRSFPPPPMAAAASGSHCFRLGRMTWK